MHCGLEMGKIHNLVVKKVLYRKKRKKVIQRRMHKTPRQACTYRIDISNMLSAETFCSIKDLLICVSQYGLGINQSKSVTKIKIWSRRKVELFFNDILGSEVMAFPQKLSKLAL